LAHERDVVARLTGERDKVSDVIRVEFNDQLASAESENTRMRKDLADRRATHRTQLNDLQATKDKELNALHERVRHTIAKKDETIRTLREHADAATLRADHLEELLTSQRDQILGK